MCDQTADWRLIPTDSLHSERSADPEMGGRAKVGGVGQGNRLGNSEDTRFRVRVYIMSLHNLKHVSVT